MIPNQTFEEYTQFGADSTKSVPDSDTLSTGFAVADVLPAEWMNWAWYHNTKGINDLNTGVASVQAELNNLVTAGGYTPTETDNTQVLNAIKYLLINNYISNNRPTLINTDTTTGSVTYDRVYSVSTAGVTLTLGDGSIVGTNIKIFAQKACSVVYGSTTYTMPALTKLELSWTGSTWDAVIPNNVSYIGTCNTQTTTSSGAMSVDCAGFVPIKGEHVNITFTYTYAYSGQPTLNVNSTGAYPVTVGGVAAGVGAFQAGNSYEFIYTGSSYDCISIPVFNSLTSNSTNCALSAYQGQVLSNGKADKLSITGGAAGDSTSFTPAFGGTFARPWFIVNSQGLITNYGTSSVTLPTAVNSLTSTSTTAPLSAFQGKQLDYTIGLRYIGYFEKGTTVALASYGAGAYIVRQWANGGDQNNGYAVFGLTYGGTDYPTVTGTTTLLFGTAQGGATTLNYDWSVGQISCGCSYSGGIYLYKFA